jgi:small GTP-binding protein
MNVARGGAFVNDQCATVGACFHIKKAQVGSSAIKFHIWDTAGQERFRALAPIYHRDAQFAILVYAIDDQDSFNEIEVWYGALTTDCFPMPEIVLVANKTDLFERRTIGTDEGKAMAKRLSALFFEVSAKADTAGIHRMFDEIAIEAVKKFGADTGAVGKPIAINDGGGGCTC